MKTSILLEKFVDSAFDDLGIDSPESNDPADSQELSFFQASDSNENDVDEGRVGNMIRRVAEYLGTDYTGTGRSKEEMLSGHKDNIVQALKDGVAPQDVALYVSRLFPNEFKIFLRHRDEDDGSSPINM